MNDQIDQYHPIRLMHIVAFLHLFTRWDDEQQPMDLSEFRQFLMKASVSGPWLNGIHQQWFKNPTQSPALLVIIKILTIMDIDLNNQHWPRSLLFMTMEELSHGIRVKQVRWSDGYSDVKSWRPKMDLVTWPWVGLDSDFGKYISRETNVSELIYSVLKSTKYNDDIKTQLQLTLELMDTYELEQTKYSRAQQSKPQRPNKPKKPKKSKQSKQPSPLLTTSSAVHDTSTSTQFDNVATSPAPTSSSSERREVTSEHTPSQLQSHTSGPSRDRDRERFRERDQHDTLASTSSSHHVPSTRVRVHSPQRDHHRDSSDRSSSRSHALPPRHRESSRHFSRRDDEYGSSTHSFHIASARTYHDVPHHHQDSWHTSSTRYPESGSYTHASYTTSSHASAREYSSNRVDTHSSTRPHNIISAQHDTSRRREHDSHHQRDLSHPPTSFRSSWNRTESTFVFREASWNTREEVQATRHYTPTSTLTSTSHDGTASTSLSSSSSSSCTSSSSSSMASTTTSSCSSSLAPSDSLRSPAHTNPKHDEQVSHPSTSAASSDPHAEAYSDSTDSDDHLIALDASDTHPITTLSMSSPTPSTTPQSMSDDVTSTSSSHTTATSILSYLATPSPSLPAPSPSSSLMLVPAENNPQYTALLEHPPNAGTLPQVLSLSHHDPSAIPAALRNWEQFVKFYGQETGRVDVHIPVEGSNPRTYEVVRAGTDVRKYMELAGIPHSKQYKHDAGVAYATVRDWNAWLSRYVTDVNNGLLDIPKFYLVDVHARVEDHVDLRQRVPVIREYSLDGRMTLNRFALDSKIAQPDLGPLIFICPPSIDDAAIFTSPHYDGAHGSMAYHAVVIGPDPEKDGMEAWNTVLAWDRTILHNTEKYMSFTELTSAEHPPTHYEFTPKIYGDGRVDYDISICNHLAQLDISPHQSQVRPGEIIVLPCDTSHAFMKRWRILPGRSMSAVPLVGYAEDSTFLGVDRKMYYHNVKPAFDVIKHTHKVYDDQLKKANPRVIPPLCDPETQLMALMRKLYTDLMAINDTSTPVTSTAPSSFPTPSPSSATALIHERHPLYIALYPFWLEMVELELQAFSYMHLLAQEWSEDESTKKQHKHHPWNSNINEKAVNDTYYCSWCTCFITHVFLWKSQQEWFCPRCILYKEEELVKPYCRFHLRFMPHHAYLDMVELIHKHLSTDSNCKPMSKEIIKLLKENRALIRQDNFQQMPPPALPDAAKKAKILAQIQKQRKRRQMEDSINTNSKKPKQSIETLNLVSSAPTASASSDRPSSGDMLDDSNDGDDDPDASSTTSYESYTDPSPSSPHIRRSSKRRTTTDQPSGSSPPATSLFDWIDEIGWDMDNDARLNSDGPVYRGKGTIPGSGFGVFASSTIHRGDTIIPYTGEIIHDGEYNRRYGNRHPRYVYRIQEGIFVDASDPAHSSIGRYVNRGDATHPNNAKMCVNPRTKHVTVKATSTILPGHEILSSYNATLPPSSPTDEHQDLPPDAAITMPYNNYDRPVPRYSHMVKKVFKQHIAGKLRDGVTVDDDAEESDTESINALDLLADEINSTDTTRQCHGLWKPEFSILHDIHAPPMMFGVKYTWKALRRKQKKIATCTCKPDGCHTYDIFRLQHPKQHQAIVDYNNDHPQAYIDRIDTTFRRKKMLISSYTIRAFNCEKYFHLDAHSRSNMSDSTCKNCIEIRHKISQKAQRRRESTEKRKHKNNIEKSDHPVLEDADFIWPSTPPASSSAPTSPVTSSKRIVRRVSSSPDILNPVSIISKVGGLSNGRATSLAEAANHGSVVTSSRKPIKAMTRDELHEELQKSRSGLRAYQHAVTTTSSLLEPCSININPFERARAIGTMVRRVVGDDDDLRGFSIMVQQLCATLLQHEQSDNLPPVYKQVGVCMIRSMFQHINRKRGTPYESIPLNVGTIMRIQLGESVYRTLHAILGLPSISTIDAERDKHNQFVPPMYAPAFRFDTPGPIVISSDQGRACRMIDAIKIQGKCIACGTTSAFAIEGDGTIALVGAYDRPYVTMEELIDYYRRKTPHQDQPLRCIGDALQYYVNRVRQSNMMASLYSVSVASSAMDVHAFPHIVELQPYHPRTNAQGFLSNIAQLLHFNYLTPESLHRHLNNLNDTFRPVAVCNDTSPLSWDISPQSKHVMAMSFDNAGPQLSTMISIQALIPARGREVSLSTKLSEKGVIFVGYPPHLGFNMASPCFTSHGPTMLVSDPDHVQRLFIKRLRREGLSLIMGAYPQHGTQVTASAQCLMQLYDLVSQERKTAMVMDEQDRRSFDISYGDLRVTRVYDQRPDAAAKLLTFHIIEMLAKYIKEPAYVTCLYMTMCTCLTTPFLSTNYVGKPELIQETVSRGITILRLWKHWMMFQPAEAFGQQSPAQSFITSQSYQAAELLFHGASHFILSYFLMYRHLGLSKLSLKRVSSRHVETVIGTLQGKGLRVSSNHPRPTMRDLYYISNSCQQVNEALANIAAAGGPVYASRRALKVERELARMPKEDSTADHTQSISSFISSQLAAHERGQQAAIRDIERFSPSMHRWLVQQKMLSLPSLCKHPQHESQYRYPISMQVLGSSDEPPLYGRYRKHLTGSWSLDSTYNRLSTISDVVTQLPTTFCSQLPADIISTCVADSTMDVTEDADPILPDVDDTLPCNIQSTASSAPPATSSVTNIVNTDAPAEEATLSSQPVSDAWSCHQRNPWLIPCVDPSKHCMRYRHIRSVLRDLLTPELVSRNRHEQFIQPPLAKDDTQHATSTGNIRINDHVAVWADKSQSSFLLGQVVHVDSERFHRLYPGSAVESGDHSARFKVLWFAPISSQPSDPHPSLRVWSSPGFEPPRALAPLTDSTLTSSTSLSLQERVQLSADAANTANESGAFIGPSDWLHSSDFIRTVHLSTCSTISLEALDVSLQMLQSSPIHDQALIWSGQEVSSAITLHHLVPQLPTYYTVTAHWPDLHHARVQDDSSHPFGSLRPRHKLPPTKYPPPDKITFTSLSSSLPTRKRASETTLAPKPKRVKSSTLIAAERCASRERDPFKRLESPLPSSLVPSPQWQPWSLHLASTTSSSTSVTYSVELDRNCHRYIVPCKVADVTKVDLLCLYASIAYQQHYNTSWLSRKQFEELAGQYKMMVNAWLSKHCLEIPRMCVQSYELTPGTNFAIRQLRLAEGLSEDRVDVTGWPIERKKELLQKHDSFFEKEQKILCPAFVEWFEANFGQRRSAADVQVLHVIAQQLNCPIVMIKSDRLDSKNNIDAIWFWPPLPPSTITSDTSRDKLRLHNHARAIVVGYIFGDVCGHYVSVVPLSSSCSGNNPDTPHWAAHDCAAMHQFQRLVLLQDEVNLNAPYYDLIPRVEEQISRELREKHVDALLKDSTLLHPIWGTENFNEFARNYYSRHWHIKIAKHLAQKCSQQLATSSSSHPKQYLSLSSALIHKLPSLLHLHDSVPSASASTQSSPTWPCSCIRGDISDPVLTSLHFDTDSLLSPLSSAQLNMVQHIQHLLNTPSQSLPEGLATALKSLNGSSWLNDDIIMGYLHLLEAAFWIPPHVTLPDGHASAAAAMQQNLHPARRIKTDIAVIDSQFWKHLFPVLPATASQANTYSYTTLEASFKKTHHAQRRNLCDGFSHILFPYNHGNNHWILFVVDMIRRTISVYDSMLDLSPMPLDSDNKRRSQRYISDETYLMMRVIALFMNDEMNTLQAHIAHDPYLIDHAATRLVYPHANDGWKFVVHLDSYIPQQSNDNDCGVHMLIHARCVMEEAARWRNQALHITSQINTSVIPPSIRSQPVVPEQYHYTCQTYKPHKDDLRASYNPAYTPLDRHYQHSIVDIPHRTQMTSQHIASARSKILLELSCNALFRYVAPSPQRT